MDNLSKKQKGFVKDYIETGNGTQSALNNYDTDNYNSANQIAIENLQKPTIIAAIQSLAERIDDETLVLKHKQFLNSDKEEIGIKALDMGYKLKGSYAAEKNINININQELTPEALAKATAFDEWYKKHQI
jgi:phage terminase small subunit